MEDEGRDEGNDTSSEKAGGNSSEGEKTEKTAALVKSTEKEAGDPSLSSGSSGGSGSPTDSPKSSPPKKGGWIPSIKRYFSQDARKPGMR